MIKLKHLLPLLFILMGWSSLTKAQTTAVVRGGFEVTPVAADDSHWYGEKGVQVINFREEGGKFFLDKTDSFYVEFLDHDMLAGPFDSVFVYVGGYQFSIPSVGPFLITSSLPSGFPAVEELEIGMQAYRGGESLPFASGAGTHIKTISHTPVFKKDTIVLGILLLILALIFKTSGMKKFAKFYKFVPALLLCYFIPALCNTFHLISGEYSELYYVASRFLLPASLILLCLSIDLKGIVRLGPKALIMFLTATVGIIIGGPVAIWLVSLVAPDVVGGEGADEVWKGLSTVAGSWIGGGANQAAMKEIFKPSTALFSNSLVVDVVVANLWMAVLLFGAGMTKRVDKWLKADSSAVDSLKAKMENFQDSVKRVASTTDIMVIVAIGLGGTALAHWGANIVAPELKAWVNAMRAEEIKAAADVFASTKDDGLTVAKALRSLGSSFLWLVVFATVIGVVLSFTKLRNYEGAGASKVGSVFLYVLVAAIGSHMDLSRIADNPGLFGVGIIWMIIHVLILLIMAKIIKAPYFFVAVGSQANVGGAASAPVVASAFSPVLAPVGVLLAVLGYAIGTFGAYLCGLIMQWVSTG